jgi:osmoprotectant transport system permease protein
MSFQEFVRRNSGELLTLTWEHLWLVALSTGIAILIGVPLGVALTRFPALSKPILGFANIMQTVPSLALFGFLIPINLYLFGIRIVGGIGAQTAVVALVLYSLLPIIRNTFTGISSVDPAIREAGRGMGMTSRQLLFQVEIPLSLGVIIAGIRVATVISVGTATIAAAIDAGGLGRYIFRGLRMNDNALILAGAVPAAFIALIADLLLGRVELLFNQGLARRVNLRRMAWVSGLAILITVGGAMLFFSGKAAERISVGAKDFTEQIILGEMISQVVEGTTGMQVTRRFDLGGNLAHEALLAGEIDLYVEYTGTALMALLKQPPVTDSDEAYRQVAQQYAAKWNIELAPPLGFNNTFAILVRGQDARQFALRSVSDIAKLAPQWRAGFGQDFMSRADGYVGFAKTYGLRFEEIREMDLSLTYRALAEKQVDIIAGNSTDGLIERYGLVQLEDDRGYFPPYDAVPVVRQVAFQQHPELRDVLRQLGGILSVQEMRKLNYAVDGQQRQANDVVREFLAKKGVVLNRTVARSSY